MIEFNKTWACRLMPYYKDCSKAALANGFIAVGYQRTEPDLGKSSLEEVSKFLKETEDKLGINPTPGSVRLRAGMLHRFGQSINDFNDVVISPHNRQFYIGLTNGAYDYDKSAEQPHKRSVKWLKNAKGGYEFDGSKMPAPLANALKLRHAVLDLNVHRESIEAWLAAVLPDENGDGDRPVDQPRMSSKAITDQALKVLEDALNDKDANVRLNAVRIALELLGKKNS